MKLAWMALVVVLGVLATGVQAHAASVGPIRLYDAHGAQVGTARLEFVGSGRVRVEVRVKGLPAGFHGFHIHSVGMCEPPAFTSAGGHHNPGGASHPEHAGDLPVLLVNDSGEGWGETMTTRFTIRSLYDNDGSAFIIHANADNYANIPTRYTPAPDATTLATGDAGGRIACGVIAPPM